MIQDCQYVAQQYMLKILGNTLNYNVLSFWDKFVHIKLYYQACEINPYIKQARNDKLVANMAALENSRAFPKNTRVIFTSRVFRGEGTDNETADNKKFGFCQFLM